MSYPAQLFGRRPHRGHAAVREWREAMAASGRCNEVVVSEARLLASDRFALLGKIRERGEPISPWGVLVRVRNGLIIESRSYLSDKKLLENVRLLGGPSTAS